jgi:hypothetical protein
MDQGPDTPWKITMLLADNAQAVGGKLYIMGGGWSLTGPAPSPSAIAIKFEVPWSKANRKLTIVLELLDSDGHPVLVQGPVEQQPLKIEAQVEVGRPPGILHGTPLDLPFALNLNPIPLKSGRYEWRCTVANEGASQTCAFTVREAPQTTPPA